MCTGLIVLPAHAARMSSVSEGYVCCVVLRHLREKVPEDLSEKRKLPELLVWVLANG
jgi:hypothetical protein